MKITSILLVALLIVTGIGIYNIPLIKTKSYEREVDALAFSYRVYSSSVCPNRTILKNIRDEYESTVSKSNVTKIAWINNNFDSYFMSACLELNPHRGDYK